MRSSHFLLYFLISILLISCGKSNQEKVDSAVREARFHLNSGDCSKAQDVLDEVKPASDDGGFVSVMASAIACFAGYNDTKAISNLGGLNTASANFIGSLAAFPTSTETSADQISYSKLKEAIDYLVSAGGTASPSTVSRLQRFGTRKGNDLSIQALLMSTVALGKFFAYYGNVNANGVKGAGSAANGCLTDYVTDPQMDNDIVADNGGANIWSACDSGNDGHADLNTADVALDVYKRRMCEAIVIFNNIFDISSNIDLSSNSTLSDLALVSTTINDMYNASFTLASSRPWGAGGDPITDLRVVTSQSVCETFSANELEIFYLSTFEALHQ